MRMPVTHTVSGGAVRVPFVSGANYPSMLRIQRYVPSGYVYTATLELRPERLTFLANTLPQAAGEQWLAFGVSPDAPACPPGLNINARGWTCDGHPLPGSVPPAGQLPGLHPAHLLLL